MSVLTKSEELLKSQLDLKGNVNIYSLDIDSIHKLITRKCYQLSSKLLDIYENDLKALDKWNLSSALVVQDQLLIDEVLEVCEEDFVDGSEPVLIKYNNNDTPRCVFLPKNTSLDILKDIRKNRPCDLNYRLESVINEDLLTLAALFGQVEVVDRLT